MSPQPKQSATAQPKDGEVSSAVKSKCAREEPSDPISTYVHRPLELADRLVGGTVSNDKDYVKKLEIVVATIETDIYGASKE